MSDNIDNPEEIVDNEMIPPPIFTATTDEMYWQNDPDNPMDVATNEWDIKLIKHVRWYRLNQQFPDNIDNMIQFWPVTCQEANTILTLLDTNNYDIIRYVITATRREFSLVIESGDVLDPEELLDTITGLRPTRQLKNIKIDRDIGYFPVVGITSERNQNRITFEGTEEKSLAEDDPDMQMEANQNINANIQLMQQMTRNLVQSQQLQQQMLQNQNREN